MSRKSKTDPLTQLKSHSATPTGWDDNWNVGVDVWVENLGQKILTDDRADLLSAIRQTKSLSAACKLLKISYRNAWQMIQEINKASSVQLIEALVGGAKGGGSVLTSEGEKALEVYHAVQNEVRRTAACILQQSLLSENEDERTIRIATAISLEELIGQICAEFTLENPRVRTSTVFAASNDLERMIGTGMAFDVFISADKCHLLKLQKRGLIENKSLRPFAVNRLALLGSFRSPVIRSLKRLAAESTSRVAIAQPQSPLGKLSLGYLEDEGLLNAIQSRLFFVDNSRAIVATVRSGVAQYGFAYANQATAASDLKTHFLVSEKKASLSYWIGYNSKTSTVDECRKFTEFLGCPKVASLQRRCGLTQR